MDVNTKVEKFVEIFKKNKYLKLEIELNQH